MLVRESVLELNGHELLLRNATENDAEMLLKYLKKVYSETIFLIKEPEEITFSPEEERKFIKNINSSKHDLILLGFLDGQHVGNCSLSGMNLQRCQHRVSMGIVLYQKYTGMGIGNIMLKKLLSIAKDMQIEQIELEVTENNKSALSLYRKNGFKICGTIPNSMKYKDGTYVSTHLMVKNLKKMD